MSDSTGIFSIVYWDPRARAYSKTVASYNFYLALHTFKVQSLMLEMWAPKVTTWRGVIWPRESLLPGGRGSEPREPRERERGAGA
jgi:hypothetical protein